MSSKVHLLIPCLVDHLYPEMGWALVKILEHVGVEVTYNAQTVCCGQPAFNSGHLPESKAVATACMETLPSEGKIVCPSGSCVAMIRHFYGELFPEKDPLNAKVQSIAGRTFEFSEFLSENNLIDKISGSYSGAVVFHNSCHSLRELHIVKPIEQLLSRISGFQRIQLKSEPSCCGFGGLFSVKFDPTAQGMAKSRLELFKEAGADTVVSNDPGCIMHLKKENERLNINLKILHVTEFVAAGLA